MIAPGPQLPDLPTSSATSVRLFWVDAFSDRPFGGNPAAVCTLDAPAPAATMQSVATELGLPETAFVWRREDGSRRGGVLEVTLDGDRVLVRGEARCVLSGELSPEIASLFAQGAT